MATSEIRSLATAYPADHRELNRFVITKTAADYGSVGEYRVINVWPNGLEDHPLSDSFFITFNFSNFLIWCCDQDTDQS